MRLTLRFLLLCAVATCAAQDNTLTPAERKAGFQLLFDGKTMSGWTPEAPPKADGGSWTIEDGALRTRPNSETVGLLSAQTYLDFEFLFDYFVSAGTNSGVKYRVQRVVCLDAREQGKLDYETNPRVCDRRNVSPEAFGKGNVVGFEFQLLGRDESTAPPYKDRRMATGSLYSMLAPASFPGKPPGEWNQARIVLKGSHIEHWINGVKVVDGSMATREVREGIAHRFPAAAAYRDVLLHSKAGPIYLQHHGGSDIRFKNLKVRRL